MWTFLKNGKAVKNEGVGLGSKKSDTSTIFESLCACHKNDFVRFRRPWSVQKKFIWCKYLEKPHLYSHLREIIKNYQFFHYMSNFVIFLTEITEWIHKLVYDKWQTYRMLCAKGFFSICFMRRLCRISIIV